MDNLLEKKESRADFRYVPLVKDLKDAMYISDDLELMGKIVGNYIDDTKGSTMETRK